MTDLFGYRYEIKFAIDPLAVPTVASWVRVHPAAFHQAFPPRLVNSLYFDDADWSSLDDNLAGVAERSKLRLRWYGEDVSAVDGSLELKMKRGELGRKIAVGLDHPLDLGGRRWSQVLRDLRSRSLGELSAAASCRVLPTLMSRYHRAYYATGDRRVRLTIDTGLSLYDQTRWAVPNLDRPTATEPVAVVELKCAAHDASALRAVASRLPLRRIAYSKYARGLLAALTGTEAAAGPLGQRGGVQRPPCAIEGRRAA